MKKLYSSPKTDMIQMRTGNITTGSISVDGRTLKIDNPKTGGNAGNFAASRRKSLWDEE